MFKSLIIGACLALAVAACASTPPSPNKAAADASAKPVHAGCVGQTATRIPLKDDECAGFGNVYSQQDLLNTGQTDPGRALRLLDPSVR